MHGDLCKHLRIDSSTDLDDRYSNLFLNAYINRHVHAKYLKMIYEVPAIHVNTSKLTYTFTSVNQNNMILHEERSGSELECLERKLKPHWIMALHCVLEQDSLSSCLYSTS